MISCLADSFLLVFVRYTAMQAFLSFLNLIPQNSREKKFTYSQQHKPNHFRAQRLKEDGRSGIFAVCGKNKRRAYNLSNVMQGRERKHRVTGN